MTVKIEKKIVGIKVEKPRASVEAEPQLKLVDIDPLNVRINERPEGTLQAVSQKITYYTQEGKKNVYVIVSFARVSGVINGKSVEIERPIEFFFPVGQLSSENQWIQATMRSISLAARGGYVTQALQDMCKVKWDKGPVRCGTNAFQKPVYHDSEVAAIGWSIQKILLERGFLDKRGNQVPASKIAENELALAFTSAQNDEGLAPSETASQGKGMVVELCPECSGDMVLMDGCPACTTCGHSKC